MGIESTIFNLADLSAILAVLVLSNMNDKECAINLSARLCYFGSMKIVGKDLRASCLSYFRLLCSILSLVNVCYDSLSNVI